MHQTFDGDLEVELSLMWGCFIFSLIGTSQFSPVPQSNTCISSSTTNLDGFPAGPYLGMLAVSILCLPTQYKERGRSRRCYNSLVSLITSTTTDIIRTRSPPEPYLPRTRAGILCICPRLTLFPKELADHVATHRQSAVSLPLRIRYVTSEVPMRCAG